MVGASLALAALLPSVAQAIPTTVIDKCEAQQCVVTMDARELLRTADKLVAEHRFAEAAPLLKALETAPQYAMERQFLLGYSAIETGDLDGAIKWFRAVLDQHPDQTRVRLELARAMQMKGRNGAADYHYRLAQQDDRLPAQIASTIRSTRGILREERKWHATLDFGFAPDSNISNGSTSDTVDVNFGGLQIPLTLDATARAKSGLGQTAGVSAGVRLGLNDSTKMLLDVDTQAINYAGKDYDDFTVQFAAGPELALNDETRVSFQALGSQRWYGGKTANRAFGGRATLQYELAEGQRVGVSLDARHNDSGFSKGYDGWQMGAYATYERVINRSLIASATLFGRRESLIADANSGTEFGANLGVGGELPLGINAGVSGGISKQAYDAANLFFSNDPRKDLRLNGRVNLGLRSVRMLGFSPSVTYSFSKSQSSISLYDTTRHRLRFGLARYF